MESRILESTCALLRLFATTLFSFLKSVRAKPGARRWISLDTFGQHLLVEYHGCDPDLLDHQEHIAEALNSAALEAGATVVSKTFHRFAPQGVSGVVVVEESHLSIHTWPEAGYAAVDFYTCGDCVPERASDLIRSALRAKRMEVLVVKRGTRSTKSIEIHRHYSEGQAVDRERVVQRNL